MVVKKENQFLAALDLGTNTFNLVIAKDSSPFTLVVRIEKGVFLGKGGLAAKKIVPEAVERAQKVLSEYSDILSKYELSHVKCVATEAIRNANNASEVLKHLEINAPFTVETIPGEREAELVYKGVKSTGILNEENCMIMDIGGGSVEFIIGNSNTIHWKKSYKIGISRALEMFPLSDPPLEEEMKKHYSFFKENLRELTHYIDQFEIKSLIGTAGSFDSWRKMIGDQDRTNPTSRLSLKDLKASIKNINSISAQKRAIINGMEEMRVETIVPAGILVTYLLDYFNFESIYQCSYSLSEGVLWELINE